MKRPADEEVEEARRVIRADYYSSVKSYAEEIAEEVKSGNIPNREALSERIWETADGTCYTIYAKHAFDCLHASDNWNAYQEDPGLLDLESDSVIHQMAFLALRADLEEELERMGLTFDSEDEDESEETDAA